MRPHPEVSPARRRGYLFVALLLLVFTVESAREISLFQRSSAEKEYRAAQDRLESAVERWEDSIVKRVEYFLQLAERQGRLLQELRPSSMSWFDGIFVWEPRSLLFPLPRVEEDLAKIRANPCIQKAEELSREDGPTGARALEGCIGRDVAVSLLAASDAAELWLNAGAPAEAARVLRTVDALTRAELALASRRGLPIRRVLSLRLQYVRVLGEDAPQMQVLAAEVSDLDGESMEGVLDLYEYPILAEARGVLQYDDDELLARAKRRVDALREIRDHSWNVEEAPHLEDGPRLYVDPVGDPPYLLFYARIGEGDTLAAVQVDQPNLIKDLLQKMNKVRPWLSIRDPGGKVVDGVEGPLGPQMAFTRVLPHLRVGLTMAYFQDNAPANNLFAQTLPMLLGLFTGIAALLALIRTDRQQSDLMEQQREFMARVTHELKTPLAGIRLMAENLELDSFRDDTKRQRFARQIVKEAERLGARVDEVLKAANRPELGMPEDVDIDAMVSEIGERWKPLFEQHGATLQVEAAPAGKVRTQRSLLRDALYNFMDNALKYRREDRPGKVIFRVSADRRTVTFDIEDNGLGVPAHMRKAIFERFRRVEGPGRGLSGGHGLGLYFVAEAARLLGGKVECREGADGGARFLLRIPRRG